jgi:PKD repeat protein
LKIKKNETGIKELFRRKLESAEVMPGNSFEAEFMKKLARKEFVRFNPARFNIYYAGLIAAALITTGILVFNSEKRRNERQTNDEVRTEIPAIINNTLNIPRGKAITSQYPEIIVSGSANSEKKRQSAPSVVRKKEIQPQETKDEKNAEDVISSTKIAKNEVLSGITPAERSGKLRENAPGEKVLFEASSYSGCQPLKIHFKSNADPSAAFSWNFGDGGYSPKKDTDWIFDVEGEYKVVLNVTTNDGKNLSHSEIITVYPRPVARFEISPENPVIPDDEIKFLNLSMNALSYKWSFGDGITSNLLEPKHRYQKFGNYDVRLSVASEYGCADSLIIANAFSGSGYFIDMPNAFIPNPEGPSGGMYSSKSDESAEIFHPKFSGVAEYQLRIFSRKSLLIFESNDVNIGWDGYFKGQLSNPGVYIWKIRGKFANGEPFIKMGDVTLLKN